MTNAALRGKPDARNPHVRFDEGEVAPAATPRRGSLLYKRREFLLGSLSAAVVSSLQAGGEADKHGETLPSAVESFAMPQKGLFAVKPHLQLLGERSAAIVWMTAKESTGFVEWSQDGGSTWTTTWTEVDGLLDAGCKLHRTVLSEFDPAKPLKFRVCSKENPHIFSYRAEFKGDVQQLDGEIAPLLPEDGKVTFAMFNDVHEQLETYPSLLAHLKEPVNLTIFAGDIANYVDNEDDVIRNLLAPFAYVNNRTHAAMWYLRGNHETRGGFSRKLRNYLALPNGCYYGAVTLGAARFVFVDTGENKDDTYREYAGLVDFDNYLERQMAWLKDEFASRTWKESKYRIAVMHIPPCILKKLDGGAYTPSAMRMQKLAKILAEANLSLVLSGHLHRSVNEDANMFHPYPVVGGGGPLPLSEDKRHWYGDPTITICSYDADKLVVSQTNVRGEKLFERHIR